jgi:hypothetical protein
MRRLSRSILAERLEEDGLALGWTADADAEIYLEWSDSRIVGMYS